MKKRRHGVRCGKARTSAHRCRCICKGKKHGATREPGGLLLYIQPTKAHSMDCKCEDCYRRNLL